MKRKELHLGLRVLLECSGCNMVWAGHRQLQLEWFFRASRLLGNKGRTSRKWMVPQSKVLCKTFSIGLRLALDSGTQFLPCWDYPSASPTLPFGARWLRNDNTNTYLCVRCSVLNFACTTSLSLHNNPAVEKLWNLPNEADLASKHMRKGFKPPLPDSRAVQSRVKVWCPLQQP